MTEETKKRLMKETGLHSNQVNSPTAEKVFEFFANEDDKAIHAEMENRLHEILEKAERIDRKMDAAEYYIQELLNASDAIKKVEDPKIKDAMVFYSFMINQGRLLKATPDETVRSAGYVVYALFGGQAKREYTFNQNDERDEG